MAESTKIEWCDHTFNPWRGCMKVAAGCTNCYAEAQSKRNQGTLGIWGSEANGATRVVAAEAQWKKVEKWNQGGAARALLQWIGPDFDSVGYRQMIFDCDADAIAYRDNKLPEHEANTAGIHTAPRPRVFVASMADVFEGWQGPMVDSRGEQLWVHPDERFGHSLGPWHSQRMNADWLPLTMADVRSRLFKLIDACQNLDFLLLTKRPERIRECWPTPEAYKLLSRYYCGTHFDETGSQPEKAKHRSNVWILTSIANQEDADRNIPHLLQCRDLAPVLGVSAEPLVGPVDLLCTPDYPLGYHRVAENAVLRSMPGGETMPHPNRGGTQKHGKPLISWCIVGGESGHNARPCNVEWIRSLVQQCKSADVPVFVKQLGACPRTKHMLDGPRQCVPILDDGGAYAMNLLDPKGGDPDEWPEDMQVREFPKHA